MNLFHLSWQGWVRAVLILVLAWLVWAPVQQVGAEHFAHRSLMPLAAAKGRWQARALEHYQLEVRHHGLSIRSGCEQVAVVQADQIQQVVKNTCKGLAVPTISDLLEQLDSTFAHRLCGANGCACDGFVTAEVAYEPQLGYPTYIRLTLRRDWTTWLFPLAALLRGCHRMGTMLAEFEVTVTPL